MCILRLVIVFSAYAVIVTARKSVRFSGNRVEGYYWRDYTGEIPGDAIPGGRDAEGRITYIGQTINRKVGVVVPGKINAMERKLYFEFDRLEHPETVDVKILCSQNPEAFHWIPTRTDVPASEVTTNKRSLVIGGHDRPHPVAIGRKMTNNELQVGKVLVIDGNLEAIHMTKDGKGWQEPSFEVLVYGEDTDIEGERYEKRIEIHIH